MPFMHYILRYFLVKSEGLEKISNFAIFLVKSKGLKNPFLLMENNYGL